MSIGLLKIVMIVSRVHFLRLSLTRSVASVKCKLEKEVLAQHREDVVVPDVFIACYIYIHITLDIYIKMHIYSIIHMHICA